MTDPEPRPRPGAYTLGTAWRPLIPLPLEETVQVRLTPGGSELAIVTRDADQAHLDTFHDGNIRIGVSSLPGALLLSVDIRDPRKSTGRVVLDGDTLVQADGQERAGDMPTAVPDDDGHLPLLLLLVNGRSGLIAGMRAITLEPRMVAAIRANLAEQRDHPVEASVTQTALRAVWDRHPNADAVIRNRSEVVVRSSALRRIPGSATMVGDMTGGGLVITDPGAPEEG
jgi:hypothetical protein